MAALVAHGAKSQAEMPFAGLSTAGGTAEPSLVHNQNRARALGTSFSLLLPAGNFPHRFPADAADGKWLFSPKSRSQHSWEATSAARVPVPSTSIQPVPSWSHPSSVQMEDGCCRALQAAAAQHGAAGSPQPHPNPAPPRPPLRFCPRQGRGAEPTSTDCTPELANARFLPRKPAWVQRWHRCPLGHQWGSWGGHRLLGEPAAAIPPWGPDRHPPSSSSCPPKHQPVSGRCSAEPRIQQLLMWGPGQGGWGETGAPHEAKGPQPGHAMHAGNPSWAVSSFIWRPVALILP